MSKQSSSCSATKETCFFSLRLNCCIHQKCFMLILFENVNVCKCIHLAIVWYQTCCMIKQNRSFCSKPVIFVCKICSNKKSEQKQNNFFSSHAALQHLFCSACVRVNGHGMYSSVLVVEHKSICTLKAIFGEYKLSFCCVPEAQSEMRRVVYEKEGN